MSEKKKYKALAQLTVVVTIEAESGLSDDELGDMAFSALDNLGGVEVDDIELLEWLDDE